MSIWNVVWGQQNWDSYYTANDLSKSMQGASDRVSLVVQDQTKAIQQGLGAINQNISHGLSGVAGTIELGITHLENGISDLKADFNILMGDVLWRLEIQNRNLASIFEVLQAPLDTAAKELRKRAENAYRNGWYQEALKDLIESESKNYQDFSVHRSIGNIYLYHIFDLEKALEYFLKAAKYAKPVSQEHSAEAEYFAATVLSMLHRYDEALYHYQQAIQLNSAFYEAHFMHACLACICRKPEILSLSLVAAIRGDYRYYNRAQTEIPFKMYEDNLFQTLSQMTQEAKNQALFVRTSLYDIKAKFSELPSAERNRLNSLIDKAESCLVGQGNFNDYIHFLNFPKTLEAEYHRSLLVAQQLRQDKEGQENKIKVEINKLESQIRQISDHKKEILKDLSNANISAIFYSIVLGVMGMVLLLAARKYIFNTNNTILAIILGLGLILFIGGISWRFIENKYTKQIGDRNKEIMELERKINYLNIQIQYLYQDW